MRDDLPQQAPAVGPAAADQRGPTPGGAEMPFLDHLEELRWRILKSLTAVVVAAVLCFVFSDALMRLLVRPYEEAVISLEANRSAGVVRAIEQLLHHWMAQAGEEPLADQEEPPFPPARRLQALRPMTYFMVTLQISLLGGLALALPVVFYQLWQFVAPGLLRREKRLLIPVVTLSVVCFAVGALVAYALVLPLGLRFFLALEPPGMTSQWAADEYIGFVLRLILGFGLVFEMPVLALFLTRIGLLTPDHLRRFRRHAIVGIFVVAAIFTPPDPVSQILMALPLLVLYEVSIWLSRASRPARATAKG